jgi:hypothetical protein
MRPTRLCAVIVLEKLDYQSLGKSGRNSSYGKRVGAGGVCSGNAVVSAAQQWYIWQEDNPDNPVGPLSRAELLRRVKSGVLNRTDLVWQEGFPDWVQAGTIKGLFKTPPPRPKAGVATVAPLVNGQPTGQVTQIELATNRKMIAQLREDATDIQPFLAELIRVMVRLNPVNIEIHEFLGFINQITENTPRQETVQLVQAAMQSVDLTNAVSMLDEALDAVTEMGPELVKSYTSDLVSVWPESRQLVRHRWLDDPIKEGENLQQQLRRAVQAHWQDLIVIQNRFRQLQEFHPRYHALMTRNSVWATALWFAAGFASAFFVGPLGAVGAEAGAQFWDNWRSKSDKEFVQTFANAVGLFSEAALSFTQKTEEEVEYVVIGLLEDLDDFTQGVIAALESVAESMDVTAIYHKLHDPDPSDKLDDDSIQGMEIVLSNLREQKISARSESNLREMLGIR